MSTGTDVLRTRRLGAVVDNPGPATGERDRPGHLARDGRGLCRFRDDPQLRVAVLRTGGDRFFSAGWDLMAAAAGEPVDGDYGEGGFGGIQLLPRLNKPVLAADGMAVGGASNWPCLPT